MNSVYTMKRIWLQKDKKAYQAWRELMEKAALQTTEALDYTVGIYAVSYTHLTLPTICSV